MHAHLSFFDLLAYTGWERQLWHDCLRREGDAVLATGVGPHGDGRFATVGDLVRHVFSAETRYVDRLAGRPITDTGAIPTDDLEALFRFGQGSRKALVEFIESCPDREWDVPSDYQILEYRLTATPRKIITHVLLHEIRHWAQIATLLRLEGVSAGFHDFLFSPVLGGEVGST